MMAGNFRKEQWKMLFVTMFCYLFFYTGRHNFGWAAQGMATALDIPYAMIGWISFSMLIGYGIGQFINGNLADRFSPRMMIPLGAILSVFANFAVSYAQSPTTVILLWALNGYFQSMAWAPGGKLITNWWSEAEHGKAFGFYTMAAGSSSAVTYLLSIYLLQAGMEWQMLFRIPVLLLLVASVVFFFIARDKPSDKGYGSVQKKDDGSPAPAPRGTLKSRYAAVFSNRSFLTACVAIGFQSMARYGLIFWVPIHYLGHSWKEDSTNLWVTFLMPVGMAFGALAFGIISDTLFKHNKLASIRFGMVASALLAMLIYWAPIENVVLSGVLMLLTGFFVYGPQANFWALCPELLGSTNTGTGIGVMNTTAYFFAAVGEPMLGYIVDWSQSTSSIFAAIAVIAALSAISISLVRADNRQVSG
ncbi:MFS transporter, OPA family, glycerol-3-phosphate transporter [Parapedobacter luteus]|uniref:MFS transporter, OPA family, glycerol-3-phosphate transporter n=1 Tax=Parapedobacter luteus TaxID=623280 RepID=A0A1T4ZY47_9SPHI|nr:MFS transporter [Parapedobacter luteus]SKB27596.1 MFS transporter, OPA family, glycerol-3-phosphate transporter [Parapedobacter luteus]